MHICTLLINDDIAIATVPGEPFVQLQLEWKHKVILPHPFVFGYTWYTGTWPNYIPDIVSPRPAAATAPIKTAPP